MLRDKLIDTEGDLSNWQNKQRFCVLELRRLVEEAENLIRRVKGGEQDKEYIRNLLNKLVAERKDIMSQLNNLADRYEDYIRSMKQEQANILRSSKEHKRMMAVSILFSRLTKQRAQTLRISLESIKKYSRHNQI